MAITTKKSSPSTGARPSSSSVSPPTGMTLADGDFETLISPKRQTCAIIFGDGGEGKCLGRGTLILMHNGFTKAVEDIRVGDLLMGPDSQPREVLTRSTGVDTLHRITPVKGASWVCNSYHVLTLVDTVSGEVYDQPLNEFLSKSKFSRRRYNARLLRSSGVDLPHLDTAISPYVLGVWLGDGSRGRPDITTSSAEIVKELRLEAERLGLQIHETAIPDHNTATWSIRAKRGKGRGVKGCNPFLNEVKRCVSGEYKQIPVEYRINDKATRLEVLAGLVDTDGFLNHNGFEIITKSPILRDHILYISRSLGFAAYYSDKQGTINGRVVGDYYRINISGDLTEVPCRVGRKKPSPRRQKKNVLRTGFTVEPLGAGDYFGFDLDGDGRFLLGDFTITHNSTLCARYAPDPMIYLNFDGRADWAVREAQDAGRKINYVRIHYPSDISRMTTQEAQKQARAAIDKTMRNFEIGVRESQRGNIRSICIDTGTELTEAVTMAITGNTETVKGDYGRSKGLVNSQWWTIFDLAREGNAHLVVLARAKEIWHKNQPTGRFTYRGPQVMHDAADWAGWIRLKKHKVTGAPKQEFELEIMKSGVNLAELGEVYTEAEWEAFDGPFVYACYMQYEGSEPEDWK